MRSCVYCVVLMCPESFSSFLCQVSVEWVSDWCFGVLCYVVVCIVLLGCVLVRFDMLRVVLMCFGMYLCVLCCLDAFWSVFVLIWLF